MAYSRAKPKSNDNKASPCFKPFLIGNMSDKCLLTRTLVKVLLRHIFISLTSSKGKTAVLLKKSYLTMQWAASYQPVKAVRGIPIWTFASLVIIPTRSHKWDTRYTCTRMRARLHTHTHTTKVTAKMKTSVIHKCTQIVGAQFRLKISSVPS